jgi:hypothetical protein
VEGYNQNVLERRIPKVSSGRIPKCIRWNGINYDVRDERIPNVLPNVLGERIPNVLSGRKGTKWKDTKCTRWKDKCTRWKEGYQMY